MSEALIEAIKSNDIEGVKVLLADDSAGITKLPLHKALDSGNCEIVKLIVADSRSKMKRMTCFRLMRKLVDEEKTDLVVAFLQYHRNRSLLELQEHFLDCLWKSYCPKLWCRNTTKWIM